LQLNKWLLLVYKIPRDPSAHRVSIWRKIKQLGAILLHDAVWVLPATIHTHEQLQWIASEIIELGGEATVFISELDGEANQAALAKEFSVKVDDSYKDIIEQLRRKNPDLAALARKYQQTNSQDYFQSKLGDKVRKSLLGKGENSS
jgi:hypothetical protein